MPTNNRYVIRSKISESKFREIVRYFSADLDATQISALSGLNRNTTNRYINAIRERIAEFCESEATQSGDAMTDESFFGDHRVRIMPGSGANEKSAASGKSKSPRKVHTQIVPNSESTLPEKSVVIGRLTRNSSMYCNRLSSHGDIVDKEHAELPERLNGIEEFWNIAKARLSKFRGVNNSTFYLHLKECEFRYNYRNENLYLKILEIVRNKPLFKNDA